MGREGEGERGTRREERALPSSCCPTWRVGESVGQRQAAAGERKLAAFGMRNS